MHYAIESYIFVVCHFDICGYFINFAANLDKKIEKAPLHDNKSWHKKQKQMFYTLLYI